MNFYIRKIISFAVAFIFLILFFISPGMLFNQKEPEELKEVNVFMMDTSRQANSLILQREQTTDRKKNNGMEEPAALRSGISVNILLYLIYKITFRNVE